MKKLFISRLAVACSLSMMATQTAYVQIKLVGTSYPSFSTSKLNLMEDTERNNTYESGYDSYSAGTLSNAYSVLIYGFIGSDKCSTIATDDLDGLQIGFTTNNIDTDYKLQFADFEGTEFVLYDRVAKKSVTINASTPDYEFTATAGQVEVNDRFVIGVPSYNVTTNSNGFASFSAAETVQLPSGTLKAYKAVYTAGNTELALTEISNIPANTGVILWNSAEASADFVLTAITDGSSDADVTGNSLTANVTAAAKPASGTTYVLSGNQMLEYVGTDNVPAHKAYLHIAASSNAPKRIRMVIEGATAVDNVEAEAVKSEKVIRDGQIVIIRNGVEYNAAGQMLK